MPNPNSAPGPVTYRDATGTAHRVVVHKRSNDAWQVIDIAVIETLTGPGEGRDAAEALARDYAEQNHHPPGRARRTVAARSAAA